MMTSSIGTIFRVTGPLCGEFTGPSEFPAQRPVTRSFDVFFDLRLNKRLSKQNVRLVIWDAIVVIMTSIWCAVMCMPQNPIDDQSTLGQEMAKCRQATSRYLS